MRSPRFWGICLLLCVVLGIATYLWGINATMAIGYPVFGAALLLDSANMLRKRYEIEKLAGPSNLTLNWPRLRIFDTLPGAPFWEMAAGAIAIALAFWGSSHDGIPAFSKAMFAVGAVFLGVIRLWCCPQVRARGIVEAVQFIPWHRLMSYTVTDHRDDVGVPIATIFTLRYRLDVPPYTERTTAIRTALHKRATVERLLTQHGVQAGAPQPDVVASLGVADVGLPDKQLLP